jgi:hypothetical protein
VKAMHRFPPRPAASLAELPSRRAEARTEVLQRTFGEFPGGTIPCTTTAARPRAAAAPSAGPEALAGSLPPTTLGDIGRGLYNLPVTAHGVPGPGAPFPKRPVRQHHPGSLMDPGLVDPTTGNGFRQRRDGEIRSRTALQDARHVDLLTSLHLAREQPHLTPRTRARAKEASEIEFRRGGTRPKRTRSQALTTLRGLDCRTQPAPKPAPPAFEDAAEPFWQVTRSAPQNHSLLSETISGLTRPVTDFVPAKPVSETSYQRLSRRRAFCGTHISEIATADGTPGRFDPLLARTSYIQPSEQHGPPSSTPVNLARAPMPWPQVEVTKANRAVHRPRFTEERGYNVTKPKDTPPPRAGPTLEEMAPLYSSFTSDHIFREPILPPAAPRHSRPVPAGPNRSSSRTDLLRQGVAAAAGEADLSSDSGFIVSRSHVERSTRLAKLPEARPQTTQVMLRSLGRSAFEQGISHAARQMSGRTSAGPAGARSVRPSSCPPVARGLTVRTTGWMQ